VGAAVYDTVCVCLLGWAETTFSKLTGVLLRVIVCTSSQLRLRRLDVSVLPGLLRARNYTLLSLDSREIF